MWPQIPLYLTLNLCLCALQRQERFTDCTALLEMEKKVSLQNIKFYWSNGKHMEFFLYGSFQSYDVIPHACFLSVSGEKDVREASCWVGRGVKGESTWSWRACSVWLFQWALMLIGSEEIWSISIHWNVMNASLNTVCLRAIQPTQVKPV